MNLIKQSMPNSKKAAIIVLNWNGWQDTLECLESLQKLNYPDYQIIVVDNGSTNDSIEKISGWIKDKTGVVLLKTGKNLGYAGGNNVGLRYALDRDFGYFWILNNDMVVDPEALKFIVKRMQEKPKAGICGSTVLNYYQRERVEAWGGAFFDKWLAIPRHLGMGKSITDAVDAEKVERRMKYVLGAAALVSRNFLLDIGLMDEDYFIYCEEVDWTARARGRYLLAYAPKSLVYHKSGTSIGSAGSAFQKYYEMRSRLLVTRKNFPYAYPTVYLGVVVEMIGMFLRGEWARAKIVWSALNNVPWEQLRSPNKG